MESRIPIAFQIRRTFSTCSLTTEPYRFFEDGRPNRNTKKKNNKMTSDMQSVPDPKISI